MTNKAALDIITQWIKLQDERKELAKQTQQAFDIQNKLQSKIRKFEIENVCGECDTILYYVVEGIDAIFKFTINDLKIESLPLIRLEQPCDDRNTKQEVPIYDKEEIAILEEIEKDFSVLYIPIWPVDATNADDWNGPGWYVIKELPSNLFELMAAYKSYELAKKDLNNKVFCQ